MNSIENNPMRKASGLIADLAGKLQLVDGNCDEHGPASVLVRREKASWHCPACLERTIADERRGLVLREHTAALMASAAIPARYVGQRFVASTADQKAVRVQVKAFRDFIVEQPRWAALVLAGECGTGKTLLACEFVESMVKNLGMSARYLTAKGMISEIQATYGREGRSEETEIARLASYDVLVIDEIDAKPDTANANLLLNEIVNRRYSDGKPVVVITNQKFSDLGQYVGDRVYSRLHENSFVCAHTWADARRAA